MLNEFLVWLNVFLLSPNPGEPFRGLFRGKRDYVKLYKTRQDYARNLKIGTRVEAPLLVYYYYTYILVYIFYNHFSIQTPAFLAKKQVFNQRCTYFRISFMSDELKFFQLCFRFQLKKLILMKIDNSCTIRPKSGFRIAPNRVKT